MTELYCPRHFTLIGEDHVEDTVLGCPPPLPVDPTIHVIATCGPCDRRLVIPVERVMKGKTVVGGGQCQLGECAATVLFPTGAEALVPRIDQAAKPRDTKGKAK